VHVLIGETFMPRLIYVYLPQSTCVEWNGMELSLITLQSTSIYVD